MSGRASPDRPAGRLTLYTRPGCHLCDEMKAAIGRATRRLGIAPAAPGPDIDEVDVSRDPHLEARYGKEVPVLLLDDVEIARHRIDDEALALRLGAVHRRST